MTVVMNFDPAPRPSLSSENPPFGSSVVGSCQVHNVFQNMAHDLSFYKGLRKDFYLFLPGGLENCPSLFVVHYLSSIMPVDWPDSLEID